MCLSLATLPLSLSFPIIPQPEAVTVEHNLEPASSLPLVNMIISGKDSNL